MKPTNIITAKKGNSFTIRELIILFKQLTTVHARLNKGVE